MICGPLEPGRDLREQLKPLASQRGFEVGETGDIPTRAIDPRDDAQGDRVGHARKDDRDRPRLRVDAWYRHSFDHLVCDGEQARRER
jgi:hypothetical protein